MYDLNSEEYTTYSSELNALMYVLDIRYLGYKRLISEGEALIEKHSKDLESQKLFYRKSGHDEKFTELITHYEEGSMLELAKVHRGSLLISLNSLFESNLKEICRIVCIEMPNVEISKRPTQVGEIEHMLNFIELSIPIDCSEIKEAVKYLKGAAKIRNQIVHNDSFVKRNIVDVKSFVTEVSDYDVKINSQNRIIFDSSKFLIGVLEFQKLFLNFFERKFNQRLGELSKKPL